MLAVIKQKHITLMLKNVRFAQFKKDVTSQMQKMKTYSDTIKSDEHKERIEFENSDIFREKAKHRYKIEAKNSELKNVHGYNRGKSYGL